MTIENSISHISQGEVEVLRDGEEQEILTGFYAPATIVGISNAKTKDFYLIDAGGIGEGEVVIRDISCKGFNLDLITKIIITHNHPDHIGDLGKFKGLTSILMPDSSFELHTSNKFKLVNQNAYAEPGRITYNLDDGNNLGVISTPGHSGWDQSVIYTNPKTKEIIAIVGDLFWSENDWAQKEDKNAEFRELCVNPNMQEKSRKYIREKIRPKIIIPGHGLAFKTSF